MRLRILTKEVQSEMRRLTQIPATEIAAARTLQSAGRRESAVADEITQEFRASWRRRGRSQRGFSLRRRVYICKLPCEVSYGRELLLRGSLRISR